MGGGSGGSSTFELVTSSAMIGGYGGGQILALYIKQLALFLTNSDNEVLIVRVEKACGKDEYKILIRLKDCNGVTFYIGMWIDICDGHLEIKKFFQSNVSQDIIDAFGFLDCDLYQYPDGDQSNECKNSVLDILKEFCSAIGGNGGSNNGGSHNGGSNNGGNLKKLNGHGNGNGGCVGDNCSNGNGNGNGGGVHTGITTDSSGIKIKLKIPGHMNPTGKTLLLGEGI